MRVRFARDALRLSQPAFATLTGIPLPSLKNYESGRSAPGADAIASLARAGISPNWLLLEHGPMLLKDLAKPAPAVDEELLSGVIGGIEAHLASEGLTLAADKKAQLVSLLYEQCREDGEVKSATILRLVRLAA